MTQRLPDEGHGVIAPGACPQLHSQAEAADDGDGRGAPHLEEKEEGGSESRHALPLWFLCQLPRFHEGY